MTEEPMTEDDPTVDVDGVKVTKRRQLLAQTLYADIRRDLHRLVAERMLRASAAAGIILTVREILGHTTPLPPLPTPCPKPTPPPKSTPNPTSTSET